MHAGAANIFQDLTLVRFRFSLTLFDGLYVVVSQQNHKQSRFIQSAVPETFRGKFPNVSIFAFVEALLVFNMYLEAGSLINFACSLSPKRKFYFQLLRDIIIGDKVYCRLYADHYLGVLN